MILKDKYKIGVLTVNIEFMWLDMKRMENSLKARLSPVFKPRHINSIFTINTPVLYIYLVYDIPNIGISSIKKYALLLTFAHSFVTCQIHFSTN